MTKRRLFKIYECDTRRNSCRYFEWLGLYPTLRSDFLLWDPNVDHLYSSNLLVRFWLNNISALVTYLTIRFSALEFESKTLLTYLTIRLLVLGVEYKMFLLYQLSLLSDSSREGSNLEHFGFINLPKYQIISRRNSYLEHHSLLLQITL